MKEVKQQGHEHRIWQSLLIQNRPTTKISPHSDLMDQDIKEPRRKDLDKAMTSIHLLRGPGTTMSATVLHVQRKTAADHLVVRTEKAKIFDVQFSQEDLGQSTFQKSLEIVTTEIA